LDFTFKWAFIIASAVGDILEKIKKEYNYDNTGKKYKITWR
jgi:hypothetical protein